MGKYAAKKSRFLVYGQNWRQFCEHSHEILLWIEAEPLLSFIAVLQWYKSCFIVRILSAETGAETLDQNVNCSVFFCFLFGVADLILSLGLLSL